MAGAPIKVRSQPSFNSGVTVIGIGIVFLLIMGAIAYAIVAQQPYLLTFMRNLFTRPYMMTLEAMPPSPDRDTGIEELKTRAKSIRLLKNFEEDIEHIFLKSLVMCGTRRHLPTLKRKKAQLIYEDDYGRQIQSDWDNEIDYFFINIVHPYVSSIIDESRKYKKIRLSQRLLDFQEKNQNFDLRCWGRVIDEAVASDLGQHRKVTLELDQMTGHDYEHFVGDLVRETGWKSTVTKGSGDQGADVIAEDAFGTRVVIQVKLYSSPVGNKAVQEAYSAMNFYDCDYACVVSNMTFTPSARKLASKTGVELLHHEELETWLPSLSTSN